MKKVAYFLNLFPKISESFIVDEIAELRRRGFDVRIFALAKPNERIIHEEAQDLLSFTEYISDIEISQPQKVRWHLCFLSISPLKYVRTLYLAYRSPYKRTFLYFKNLVFLARRLQRERFQHIHAHFADVAGQYALLVSMLSGIPYTFTTHGYDVFFTPPNNYRERVIHSRGVIVVSKYNGVYLFRHFDVPQDKIHVIYFGVDPAFFVPPREERTDNVILTVARLHPVKGLDVLIDACGILRDKGRSFRCIIIGDGEERGRLSSQIDQLDLNNWVQLVGAKPRGLILDYYQGASAFVLPSHSEAMPISLMEAMSCQLPVVATDVNGVSELVENGNNGFLVRPRDPVQLSACLERLLDDPELGRRMGRQGRSKIVRTFNQKRQIDELLALWDLSTYRSK